MQFISYLFYTFLVLFMCRFSLILCYIQFFFPQNSPLPHTHTLFKFWFCFPNLSISPPTFFLKYDLFFTFLYFSSALFFNFVLFPHFSLPLFIFQIYYFISYFYCPHSSILYGFVSYISLILFLSQFPLYLTFHIPF